MKRTRCRVAIVYVDHLGTFEGPSGLTKGPIARRSF